MSVTFATHIAAIILNLVLGIGVYFTNRRRATNQCFLALSIILTLYLVWLAIGFVSSDVVTVAVSVRGCAAVGACFPLVFNWLRLSITRRDCRWQDLVRDSARWIFVTAIIVGLCFTPFFVRDVQLPAGVPTPRAGEPIYGHGIVIVGIFYALAIMLLARLFLLDIRRSQGIVRTELQFVMLGSAVGLALGLLFAIVLPAMTGRSSSVQLTPIPMLVLNIIIAYGIATRRIMEVGYLLRSVTARLFLVLSLVALYTVVLTVSRTVMPAFMPWHDTLPHLLAALAVVFSMSPASGLMQRLAHSLFVTVHGTDAVQAARDTGTILQSIGSLDNLLAAFAKVVTAAVGTDRVAVYLLEHGRFVRTYPPRPDSSTPVSPDTHTSDWAAETLPVDSPLVTALAATTHPLVVEIIQRSIPSHDLELAAQVMRELDVAAAVPIRYRGEINGLMFLGPRLSGSIYGTPEQDALQGASERLGAAVENAKLYTQLEDSKLYSDMLVDNLVSGVIAAGNDRVVTVCNREATRTLRLPGVGIVGHPVDRLPPPIVACFEEMIAARCPIRNRDLPVPCGPGDSTEMVPIRLGGDVFHGHKGEVSGVLLVFNDMTHVRKLETQVRRTAHLASLGTLSAGMAHEIKNPLVTLKTFSQLLPERYQDDEFRRTFTMLVGKEVNRIDSIVNQLLKFGRPAKAKLRNDSLRRSLEQSLQLVRAPLRQKGVEVVTEWCTDDDLVQCDPDLLDQAFVNLFLNAIDAMENGGTLTIKTELVTPGGVWNEVWKDILSQPHVSVTVRDTGKGIPDDNLSQIFDPFFTTKSTGTGLGLSVVHGIFQEHNAIIDVESEVGRGTAFHIAFPKKSAAEANVEEEWPAAPSRGPGDGENTG